MATFVFSGFYDVPIETIKKGSRFVDDKTIKAAMKKGEDEWGKVLSKNGVYTFSIRAGKGRKPWYVGKSVKSNFGKEAFNTRNCLALSKLINSRKGSLEVSFLSQQKVRGNPNLREISEIEYLLIGHAAERNSELLNKHNTNQDDTFEIKNIYNSGKKKPSKCEAEFIKLMGI